MANSETLGDWLRQQIDRRSTSAREIADSLGVTPKTVHDWIGEKTKPRDEHAAKLADLLGLDEIAVRRRFGLWVPQDAPSRPERSADEEQLAELERLAHELLQEIEQLRHSGEDERSRKNRTA